MGVDRCRFKGFRTSAEGAFQRLLAAKCKCGLELGCAATGNAEMAIGKCTPAAEALRPRLSAPFEPAVPLYIGRKLHKMAPFTLQVCNVGNAP